MAAAVLRSGFLNDLRAQSHLLISVEVYASVMMAPRLAYELCRDGEYKLPQKAASGRITTNIENCRRTSFRLAGSSS